MHFHHRHDLDGCTDDHADQPLFAALLATLDRMEHHIMSANQDAADALAARIDAAEARIEAKLAAPAAEVPVDFTALTAAADKLDALVPAPAPAPVPAAPVDVPAVPADGTVPVPADSIPSVPSA